MDNIEQIKLVVYALANERALQAEERKRLNRVVYELNALVNGLAWALGLKEKGAEGDKVAKPGS